MGICNYCILKDIKSRHKGKGRIYAHLSPVDEFTKILGRGIDVVFVPKGKTIADGKILAWFMELSKKCMC